MQPTKQVAQAVVDWRGVEIAVGATVIYAAGTNGAIVEGTVLKVTPQAMRTSNTSRGLVKVEIIRRNDHVYWHGTRRVNTIGSDRVTVVDSLPVATKPTLEELERQKEIEDQNRDSHTNLSQANGCSRCHVPWREAGDIHCPYGRLPE